jgi:tripartite ATP-independent transporter DctM subunit
MIGLFLFSDQPLFNIPAEFWDLSNSFILTAVPLFIFMGEVFDKTGISRRLFWAVDRWLGFLPGGVACTVIGACSIFAAISGSSVAGAATMGTIAIPSMRERKYNMSLTFGVIAAGGTLGILIPPSVIMIIYGAFQGLSIGRLFAAGIIPGVILASLFLLSVMIGIRLRPQWAPKPESYTWRQRLSSLSDFVPSLLLILIILGGVFTGVMTPTEAAAVGCVAALLLGLVYRQLNWKIFSASIEGAVRITAMVMLVAVGAKALAFLMNYLQAGEMLSGFILGAGLGKYGTLALIFAAYLVLGMFFEGVSMMVLTLPFVIPIITGLGLSPYWFNVPLVLMVEASLITPPVGLNLYVLQGIAPDYDVLDVAKGALPFLLPIILVVALVSVFPQLALWLPEVIYGR